METLHSDGVCEPTRTEMNKATVDAFIQQQIGLACQQVEHSCHMMQQVQTRLEMGRSLDFNDTRERMNHKDHGLDSSFHMSDTNFSAARNRWHFCNMEQIDSAAEELRRERWELRELLAKRQADLTAATAVAEELQTQVEMLLAANIKLRHQIGHGKPEESNRDVSHGKPEQSTRDVGDACSAENDNALRSNADALHVCSSEGKEATRTPLQPPAGLGSSAATTSNIGQPCDGESKDVPRTPSPNPAGRVSLSATVASIGHPVLGFEAEQVKCHIGRIREATEEKPLLEGTGCSKVFRIGRVGVPAGASAIPVCIRLVVVNSGKVEWPQTVAAISVRGDPLGAPLCAFGQEESPIAPGGHAELALDLTVPAAEPGIASSLWALVDAATGCRLGPLLVLDVERKLPSLI